MSPARRFLWDGSCGSSLNRLRLYCCLENTGIFSSAPLSAAGLLIQLSVPGYSHPPPVAPGASPSQLGGQLGVTAHCCSVLMGLEGD